MALEVSSFSISDDDVQAISNDPTQVTTRVVYDSTPPAGWMIIAEGPLGSRIICPKPCGSVNLPPPK